MKRQIELSLPLFTLKQLSANINALDCQRVSERYFWGPPAIISFTFTVPSPTVIMVTFFPPLRGSWTISSSTIRTHHTLNNHKGSSSSWNCSIYSTLVCTLQGKAAVSLQAPIFFVIAPFGFGKWVNELHVTRKRKEKYPSLIYAVLWNKNLAVVSRRLFARNRHE